MCGSFGIIIRFMFMSRNANPGDAPTSTFPSPLSGFELCRLSDRKCTDSGEWTGKSDLVSEYLEDEPFYNGKIKLQFYNATECNEFVRMWNDGCDEGWVSYWEFFKKVVVY